MLKKVLDNFRGYDRLIQKAVRDKILSESLHRRIKVPRPNKNLYKIKSTQNNGGRAGCPALAVPHKGAIGQRV